MNPRIVAFLIGFTLFMILETYSYFAVRFLVRNLTSTQQTIFWVIYGTITAFILISCVVFFMGGYAYFGRILRTITMGLFMANLLAKLSFTVFLLIDDLVRLVRWIGGFFTNNNSNTDGQNSIPRSDFLIKIGASIGMLNFITMSWGVVNGAYNYKVHKVTVRIKNLPADFEGYKIAQLSDIHSGSFFNKNAVKKGIKLLNDQQPDLFVFTGDIVNELAIEMYEYLEVFKEVKAKDGYYSILGNHDYGEYHRWNSIEDKVANFEAVKDIHTQLGWRLLLDEHVQIKRNSSSINLIGIENWGDGFIKKGNMAKALDGLTPGIPNILLSHDPSHWTSQVRKFYPMIDLALAGHTHGMQFGIEKGNFKWSPVQYRYKYWGGLYQEDHQQIYVNRGFGFIGYPGRVGINPEITILTLVKG